MSLLKNRPETQKAFEALFLRLPGGVSSPVRSCRGVQSLPVIVDSGSGAHITDIDNNRYLDFCGSWGALLHGHAHPAIVNAATARIAKGSSFGITTLLEQQLAEKIQNHIPSMEMLRFVSSGTEATMTALRVARGFTGKDGLIKFTGHYHGHLDPLLIQAGSGAAGITPTSSSQGIPKSVQEHTHLLPFNDEAALTDFFSNKTLIKTIAAIILEPIPANMGLVPPTPSFIKAIERLSKEHGVLLIFDEVITGFRVGLGGAQALYQIQPDLTCLGKIIGGGFPAAAVGGRREIMSCLAPLGAVYQAGTLSGNPVALAAGLAALTLAEAPQFYDKLAAKTERFLSPIQTYIVKQELPIIITQCGSMFSFFFDTKEVINFETAQKASKDRFTRLFQWLLNRNIYAPPAALEAWFISSAHGEEELTTAALAIIDFLKAEYAIIPG